VSAYRRILVAVDGSEASKKGLREALRLAKAERARLFLVHVVDEYPAFAAMDAMMAGAPGADLVPALREGGKRILARAKAAAEKSGVAAKTILREMLSGPAAGPIVREARKLGADLIVVGTHGRRGVRRLVLGSDAEQVVRNSSVPVLLVRG
jgi:nucleotide-binding universal stress UspA family protein